MAGAWLLTGRGRLETQVVGPHGTVSAMVRSLAFILKFVGSLRGQLSPIDVSSKGEGEQSEIPETLPFRDTWEIFTNERI